MKKNKKLFLLLGLILFCFNISTNVSLAKDSNDDKVQDSVVDTENDNKMEGTLVTEKDKKKNEIQEPENNNIITPKIYGNINLGNPGKVLSTYFTSYGINNMYVGQSSTPNYYTYKTAPTNSGIALSGVRQVLNDTLSTSRDFFFVLGSTTYSRNNNRPAATAWTLYNGDYPIAMMNYQGASLGLSTVSLGTNVYDSVSIANIQPSNPNITTSVFQNPNEAYDTSSSQYSQVITTDTSGKLKREGPTLPVGYTGYTVSSGNSSHIQSISGTYIFKYTANNRTLEAYGLTPTSSSSATPMTLLYSKSIPTTWSSMRLMWSSTIGNGANLTYMGWVLNSGYQELKIPIQYVYNGTIVQTSALTNWQLNTPINFSKNDALNLANDNVKNNYTIENISGSAGSNINYGDILPINNLNRKPIIVNLGKAPTTKNVKFNAYSMNEEPNSTHETAFGDVIFQNKILTIPYAQTTVNMGTLSEINTFKNKLTSNGYEITKIRTFQSNGTVIDITSDAAIPAETPLGFQNVIYFYKAKESTIKVQFVDESGTSLAPDVSINAKVPDKTIDLTKNQSVQNTLSNLANSNYSVITRPNNETALPVDTSKTVKYVLKKNERSKVVDPSDGTTPFVPKDSNGNDAKQNTTTEDLRIQYVSDFDFGKHSQSMDEVNTLAAADRGIRQNESTAKDVVSFISVIDDRAVQSNWTLNVSASPFRNNAGQTLSGATIQLSGLNYKSPASDKPVAETGIKDISSGTTRISYANKKLSLKSWSLSFGELTNNKESSGAKLIVPANTPKDVGQYQSTINWNLVTGTP